MDRVMDEHVCSCYISCVHGHFSELLFKMHDFRSPQYLQWIFYLLNCAEIAPVLLTWDRLFRKLMLAIDPRPSRAFLMGELTLRGL